MAFIEQINHKIYMEADAFLETLLCWRNNQEKIVFTNGCFDVIHRGHADSLAKAADMGSRLVVGLNSDQSVRILKGSNRPIVDEYSRAFLLASFSFVDAVVLFQEETPYELIKVVLPDILIKGNDYKPEEIVGYDVVTENGGRVETIELVPGFSTSEILKKMTDLT